MSMKPHKFFWEITGFTKEKILESKSIKSEVFKISVDLHETEWFLKIQDETDKLSMYLHNKSKSKVDSTFEFGIVSSKTDYRNLKIKRSGQEWVDAVSTGFGNPNFIDYAKLFDPDNGYITDGKITLFCELFLGELSLTELSNKQQQNILSGMFFKDKFKDCQLQASDGELFKCHKAVLAFRSTVFEGMFTNAESEEFLTSLVKIEVNSQTMEQFLRFIYGLEIQNLNEIAFDLFIAADKYLMDELKEICIENLMKNLSKENVLKSLIIADKIMKAEKLFDACLIVIGWNFQFLSKTPEWKALSPPLLFKIIETLMPRSISHRSHVKTCL